MKLQAKLMLTMGLVFLLFFGIVQYFDHEHIKEHFESDLSTQARSLNAVLMATRSVYHQEFLGQKLSQKDKTMGCLPRDLLGRISKDFKSLEHSEISFVNLPDVSPKGEKAVNSDTEDLFYFIAHPQAKERIVPIKTDSGQSYYQYSTPLLVEPYCLKCHEERDASLPASAVGNQTDFNYRVGEMHGMMSIRFTADELNVRTLHQMKSNSVLHFAGFLLTFLTISLLLRISVINKLESLKKATARLSGGDLQVRAAVTGTDEIAEVAAAFNSMAASISERTELLHKSQASLANAQRIARLGNWDWDIPAKKWYWSDETYRLFGSPPQAFEPTFATFLELLHPEDRKLLEGAVQRALAGEGGYSLEYRIRLPDERIRCFYEQGEVTFDKSGRPVNMVGTLYDITDRKLAEKEVEEKHAFLQTIIDGVADPIMVIALDHRIIMMNQTASSFDSSETRSADGRLCCYQVSHHAEQPCSDTAHPCPLEEVRRTGKPTTVVHEHILGNDEVRTFELQATPLWNEDGTLRGIIEASRDITDRVAAEARLRENELRLKLLAHHDNLTNLPNRLLFHDRLLQAMVKARRSHQQVALLFLDLDRFKNINDSLGMPLVTWCCSKSPDVWLTGCVRPTRWPDSEAMNS
jgi:PAS domain-containing protein